MLVLFNLFVWFSVSFAPGTTLEDAVAQTPEMVGMPYYWTVKIEGERGLSGAVMVTSPDMDWQAKYDETWKRVDRLIVEWEFKPDRELPYERGCWDRHDCPPITVHRAGNGPQLNDFFAHLLRLLSSHL
jgi:hypothetical protein